MNETYDLRVGESHIEVHKFHGGTILLSLLIAVVLQSFLPVYIAKAGMLDLPLLGTIYGLLQDSLSKTPLGLFGIAKTVIGYLASSIGARLDTEHPAARFALTGAFFVLHQGIVILIQKLLLAQPQPWFTMRLLVACLVNATLGVFLYYLLDRLRKS